MTIEAFRKHTLGTIVLACTLPACSDGLPGAGKLPAWRDPEVIAIGREPARAAFVAYETAALARAAAPERSRFYRSLDGMWKFSWTPRPAERPAGFYMPDFDVSGWDDIAVPGNWERQGYGKPRYVNVDYVFPADEPVVPTDDNPVGAYRREFTIPDSWSGRRIFVRFGAANSGLSVWVNGEPVGYSEDSKLPAEFDITDRVHPGGNVLAAEVIQWTSGSYLEDQDFWSLSGLERSVELLARPQTYIRDFFVRAGLGDGTQDGRLQLDVDVAGDGRGYSVAYRVVDGNGVLASGATAAGAPVAFAAQLSGIRPWSAESPQLYGLYLELQDADGATVEAVYTDIGFRNVEVRGGRLFVNGRAVTLRGVNRHEHHPVTGRVLDTATMLRDVELLKQFNFNAVRTSHYPNDPRWYALTDRYGIYVVDEANIESHAYMGRGKELGPQYWLGNKPYFLQSHLARVGRMIERDKNHPSIILWSLGNEAGLGTAFEEAARRAKQRDPTRIVAYEGTGQTEGHDPRPFADLYTPMYDRVAEMQDYLSGKPEKAIIQFEYAHAMGNSLGGFREYWDLIWSQPMAQGGFIWDWVDQTFLEHRPDGTPFWAYGGDFDEGRNDGNFLANGLLQPDRTPNPHAWEAAKVMQPVSFTAGDAGRGEFVIGNRHDHIDLSGLRFSWLLEADGAAMSSGTLAPLATAPGDAEFVSIRLPRVQPKPGVEYFLTLRAIATSTYQPLVPEGHVVAWEQFALPWGAAAESPADSPPLQVERSAAAVHIRGDGFDVTVDARTGLLSSLRCGGIETIRAPLQPNFWRAPVDNDVGAGIPQALAVWKSLAGSRELERLELRTGDDGSVTVSTHARYADGGLRYATDYRVYGSGDIVVSSVVEPEGDAALPEFYRVGMTMVAPGEFGDIRWFGRGPQESYVDRKASAAVGLYAGRVATQFHDYSRPQETGNKEDVRWLAITNADGAGLAVIGQPLISVTALPFPYADLDYVPGAQKHGADLVPQDLVTLNIDLAQMGLGGDNSWGFWPLPEYRLPPGRYSYAFRLRAFGAGEDPGRFARLRLMP